MAEEHYLPLEELVYEISRSLEPLVTIRPGDTVIGETEDALSGQIQRPGDRRDRATRPFGDPVCGPIVIEGAKPGDVLRVRVLEIQPLRGHCATYLNPTGPFVRTLGPLVDQGARVCRVDGGRIEWNERITIPYNPMIGLIACAPAMGSPTTADSGDYGGNMDIREIRPGATVFLPVQVPGGYLYFGDCHAAQGAGEVSGIGLEMAARTTIVVDLETGGSAMLWPRIETETDLLAVACGRPVEDAIGGAFSRLALWLEERVGWPRWESVSLLSQVGELSVGYYWGGAVAAKISKKYLA